MRDAGYETIMVNSNPETVSTDYDTSDHLFFEPLTTEDVLNIYERMRPEGAIVQFGGQTPLNLARGLEAAGVPIIGTSVDTIEDAEDRENPVKPRDEHRAHGNHQSAHDERAKDAPGQHPVLHAIVDVKGAKNHEKDEEIVDAQGFFDHVASEIFKAALLAIPVPDAATETDGDGDP